MTLLWIFELSSAGRQQVSGLDLEHISWQKLSCTSKCVFDVFQHGFCIPNWKVRKCGYDHMASMDSLLSENMSVDFLMVLGPLCFHFTAIALLLCISCRSRHLFHLIRNGSKRQMSWNANSWPLRQVKCFRWTISKVHSMCGHRDRE